MDKLMSSTDIADVLGCSRDQALILMRTMRHMDISANPKSRKCNLRVWESDFRAWLESRARDPLPDRKKGRKSANEKPDEIRLVPYRKRNGGVVNAAG